MRRIAGPSRHSRARGRGSARLERWGALPVAVAFLAAISCTTNPVSGRREVILMSEEQEQQIDEREARIVEEQVGLVGDPELKGYIDAIGQELASFSPRQDVDYHFNIVEMEEPNAFALPGGHIYVTRGLLAISNSEAEIANVIGHEIGHVAARHAAQRHVRATTVGLLTVLGTVGAVLAGGGGAEVVGVNTLGQGLLAAYGRNQEREADIIGQDLAVRAGIDPLGMSQFLRTLDKTTRLTRGFSRAPGFLDTHPATPQRVAENTTSAQTRRWKPDFEIAGSRRAYLEKLDGLAVGKPAAEGVFRGDRFLHADLGVSLRFPYGWQRANQRSRVIAASPDHSAIAVLEMQGPGQDPRLAATSYAAQEGLRFATADSIRIGNLRAFRARAAVPTPSGSVDAEITWIAHRGQIYRLSAAARPGAFGRHEGIFRSFARSFRPIRDAELELIDELRLRVVDARAGETLAELSERTGNEWDLNMLAVANGLYLDDRLEEGFPVKVALRERYVPDGSVPAAPSPESPSDGDEPSPEAAPASGERPIAARGARSAPRP